MNRRFNLILSDDECKTLAMRLISDAEMIIDDLKDSSFDDDPLDDGVIIESFNTIEVHCKMLELLGFSDDAKSIMESAMAIGAGG